MGILDRWLNLDDVRGVRLKVDAAPEFRWSAGVLPVTLTFEGRGKEDMTALQVEVAIEQDDDRAEGEEKFLHTFRVRESIPAGQTVVRTYEVPLVLDDRPVDSSHPDQVPGWMAGLVRKVGMGSVGFVGPCELEVLITYESTSRPGKAERPIHALGD